MFQESNETAEWTTLALALALFLSLIQTLILTLTLIVIAAVIAVVRIRSAQSDSFSKGLRSRVMIVVTGNASFRNIGKP